MRDDELMQRAIEIARPARRNAAPRPAVGCVIARDGEIVGEGATGAYPSGAHAEAVALQHAGARARGATVYTTLEPCDHHGNTPPCTDALIDAGVARVVVALGDPDEKVAGRGFARLTGVGIEVATGIGAGAAAHDLAPYLHHRRTGRAFVTVKVAVSLDGRVAAADGSSRWITADAARADAHELRADAQAVVVGAGTAIADRPALTVRDVADAPAHPPWRVLLDARGRVAAAGPLFDPAQAPTLVVTTDAADPAAVDAWQAAGAKVERVAGAPGGVGLDATFDLLGRYGVLHALVEGGGTLVGAVISGAHASRVIAYVAPTLLGTEGLPGFGFAGPRTLADAARLELVDTRVLGPDVRLEYTVPAR